MQAKGPVVVVGWPTPGEEALQQARLWAELTEQPLRSVAVPADRGVAEAEILRTVDRFSASMIVIEPDPPTSLSTRIFGGTLEALLRAARVPVLVARASPSTKLVLAATDLSDPALPALRAAAEFARRRGYAFAALHCYDSEPIVTPTSALDIPPMPIDPSGSEGRRQAAAALGRVLAQAHLAAQPLIQSGPAIERIIPTAQAVASELLVVGTVGRTGLARWVFGNLAERIARGAPCSTLVVRLDAQHRSRLRAVEA